VTPVTLYDLPVTPGESPHLCSCFGEETTERTAWVIGLIVGVFGTQMPTLLAKLLVIAFTVLIMKETQITADLIGTIAVSLTNEFVTSHRAIVAVMRSALLNIPTLRDRGEVVAAVAADVRRGMRVAEPSLKERAHLGRSALDVVFALFDWRREVPADVQPPPPVEDYDSAKLTFSSARKAIGALQERATLGPHGTTIADALIAMMKVRRDGALIVGQVSLGVAANGAMQLFFRRRVQGPLQQSMRDMLATMCLTQSVSRSGYAAMCQAGGGIDEALRKTYGPITLSSQVQMVLSSPFA